MQLITEVEAEDWIVSRARKSIVLTDKPEGLWGQVLREMGNKYSILANFPEDPSLN